MIRDAAELLALARMVAHDIGVNPKATPRKLTALQKTAEGKLASLARMREARMQRQIHDPLHALMNGGE